MATYCTVQDIIAILPHRRIDQESTVTITDVNSLIVSVDKIVKAKIKIEGIDLDGEIIALGYADLLNVIETLMVAGWVEQRFKGDAKGDEGEEPNNNYYKEGRTLLNDLCQNTEFEPVEPVENSIESMTGRAEDLKARFTMSGEEW